MAQHFLLSAAARSLSPAKVMRMSEQGAQNVFARLRWPQTDGKPVCPGCGCQICYDCRRSRSEEHTSELQSHHDLVCRLLLEKKKKKKKTKQLQTKKKKLTKHKKL